NFLRRDTGPGRPGTKQRRPRTGLEVLPVLDVRRALADVLGHARVREQGLVAARDQVTGAGGEPPAPGGTPAHAHGEAGPAAGAAGLAVVDYAPDHAAREGAAAQRQGQGGLAAIKVVLRGERGAQQRLADGAGHAQGAEPLERPDPGRRDAVFL